MGKLIPVILAVLGLGGGVGAGLALRPPPEPASAGLGAGAPCGEGPGDAAMAAADAAPAAAPDAASEGADAGNDFVKLANQFVIPLIDADRVAAMVVLTLSLEVAAGQTEGVHAREPKLRDRFLRVLLDHANAAGFDGAFTRNGRMAELRAALLEAGRAELGPVLADVLILDINRQEV